MSNHLLASLRVSAGKLTARALLYLSLAGRATGGALSALYRRFIGWLEARVFPRVVGYAAHPLTILATMLLLVPLIVFASLTAFVLMGNTYLNVCSAAVSSIVLMQSLRHHRENKQLHAANAAALEVQTMAHRAALRALQRQVDALSARVTPPTASPTTASPTAAPTPAAQSRKSSTKGGASA